ncbi:hypothetical protein PENTCL1PPCAC_13374, partial [Pristionchus entomophagus]
SSILFLRRQLHRHPPCHGIDNQRNRQHDGLPERLHLSHGHCSHRLEEDTGEMAVGDALHYRHSNLRLRPLLCAGQGRG